MRKQTLFVNTGLGFEFSCSQIPKLLNEKTVLLANIISTVNIKFTILLRFNFAL